MENKEWRKYQKETFPKDSKEKALKGKSVMEAFQEEVAKRNPEKKDDFNDEFMNDLARAFAWRIIKDVQRSKV